MVMGKVELELLPMTGLAMQPVDMVSMFHLRGFISYK